MYRVVVAVLFAARIARADGLLDETYLHPVDAFTAHTLRAGELVYAQPLSPFPGWGWIGVTDDITVEVDITPLLGGLFEEPHLPVPSCNVRWRFWNGGRSGASFALEAMGQYLWHPYKQEELDHLVVTREHLGGFVHVNASVPVGDRAWIHLSAGASYQRSYEVTNRDREVAFGQTFVDLVSPDASLGIDVRAHRRLSLHATGSYGSTFIYSDNEPRKWQLGYGMRVAPFLDSSVGFLHAMRLELVALVMYRPDARELAAIYLPIYPYVYWQWHP
jgi:hypothetical protein